MAKPWYTDRWLLLILLVSAALALSNLGDRHFWGDEVHLLNLGKSVANYGLPVVDDNLKHIEATYETDDVTQKGYSETVTYGARIFGKDVYSLHPWLVSYIASVPIALFGAQHEFWIRLPFVLIGLLAIPILFVLALRISRSRRVALLSALLLSLSTVYLLALRNANYYGLILFAVPATLLCYLRTLDKEKNASWQFALAGTMLFHSQWLVFMGTMLGIAAHFVLFNRNLKAFKRIIAPLAGMFVLTFPWFVLTGQFSKASAVSTPIQYALLLAISAYHWIIWFVPLVFLIFVPWIITSKKKKWQVNSGYALLALVVVTSFLFSALNYYTGTPIRYYYGLLPLAMLFNAAVIDKAWQWKKEFGVILVVLFVLTNWLAVAPLLPFKGAISGIAGSHDVLGTGASAQEGFVAKTLRPRVLFTEYLDEITHHVTSPTRAVIDAVEHAAKKGTNIYVGVADANAIGYYTGLQPATYANNLATRDYDWVVLPIHDPRNSNISANYTKIMFPYATERWGDTADPVHHLFATTEGEGFSLYEKQ
jgi:4-amino-4-deoxy-L-arabinose transferase-like glycosyltransferase